ncbi:uncharacterized protein LOC114575745 [Exaiptasia diaphana]|uniref:Uncharacterized protein n=1 Tax=Exaiptasia diaphana TaxID=2652724 RepID=A0A913YSE5_EXADI|nr:uncharacterized protein LOC114575745 [Exaiptasia diaphana]
MAFQDNAVKQEVDKLNAKVTELQFELQTKNYEETIWHTAYSDLTDKLKRLESELEKNITKENTKSKVNYKVTESPEQVKRTFIQDYHDGKLEKNITEENNTKSKVSESSQKVKREFTHDDDDEDCSLLVFAWRPH